MTKKRGEIIVALDVETFEEARTLIDELSDIIDVFKVGSQLFTACGPVVVRYIQAKGKRVFLDLKFHDIPNTVGNALRSAVNLSVPVYDVQQKKDGQEYQPLFMCTVHTLGGKEMMEFAVKATKVQAKRLKVNRPLIVGITVLTSDKKVDNIQKIVCQRARLAKDAGLDGVVASAQEVQFIREEIGDDFVIVTPGIRPQGASSDDQERIATPKSAIESGSNFLVIGRPIVKASLPKESAKKILEEIKNIKS